MFHASILELQSQIHYHQEEAAKLEQELYTLKSYEEFAGEAFDLVRDTVENIEDPRCLELFKESLLSLFPEQPPIYLEEKIQEEEDLDEIEYIDDSHPEYRSIEHSSAKNEQQIQKEEPNTVVAVFHSEEHLKKQSITPEYTNDEVPPEPSESNVLLEDPYEGLIAIAKEIYFNPATNHCYLGFSNRNRATEYGAHLKEIHEIYNSRYTVGKPSVTTHCKHELVIEFITEANARKLADLNLKKSLAHSSNQAVTDTWRIAPTETKEYPKIDIAELELADLVTKSPHGKSFYEVIQNCGQYVITRCIKHHSIPSSVGEEYFLNEAYLVEKGDSIANPRVA